MFHVKHYGLKREQFAKIAVSMKIKLRLFRADSKARFIFIIASESPFDGLSSGLA